MLIYFKHQGNKNDKKNKPVLSLASKPNTLSKAISQILLSLRLNEKHIIDWILPSLY